MEVREPVHHNLLLWLLPFEHIGHGHFFVGLLSIIFWIVLSIFFYKHCSLFYYKKINNTKSYNIFSSSRRFIPVVLSFFIFISVAYAMCPGVFSPPQRMIMPDDNTHGLLVFNSQENKETLVLEPAFHGNAVDFGMVMPTPSKPELLEADEKIFVQLEELTNPFTPRFAVTTASAGESVNGVQIIEVKDVGDFTATTLIADDTLSLIKWLNQNNYIFKAGDVENFEYYVKRGGYFFVVLKVNIKKAKVDEKGNINGKLRPIEFTFKSDKPMLPIRIMRNEMEAMSFTLYTISDIPYYIPGTKILFSRQLTETDFSKESALEKYANVGKWLVRSNIRFNFTDIRDDLFLESGNEDLVVRNSNEFKIVNPELLPKNNGILLDEGSALYIGNEKIKNDLRVLSTKIEKLTSDTKNLSSTNEKIEIDIRKLSTTIEKVTNDLRKLSTITDKIENIQKKYELRIFSQGLIFGVLSSIIFAITLGSVIIIFKKKK